MKYTNDSNIGLSVAVYLANDTYDHIPNTISTTALMKGTKKIILGGRVDDEKQPLDISSFIKSNIGTSVHDGIEASWRSENLDKIFASLGYSEEIAKRIKINPSKEEITDTTIPIYMEQRMFREILGVNLSGKFDFIGQGLLEDFKTTGTFKAKKCIKEYKAVRDIMMLSDTECSIKARIALLEMSGPTSLDYILQGSIYRWLDQGERITSDNFKIQMIITDWSQGFAAKDSDYPQCQVTPFIYPLLSLDQTQEYIENKLNELDQMSEAFQDELPSCSKYDLWQDDSVFKYYKDPTKYAEGGKSTKNSKTSVEAYERYDKDGGVGLVVEVPGKAKSCNYCSALPICKQASDMIKIGILELI